MPLLRSQFGPAPSLVAGRIKAERLRLGIPLKEAARRLKIQAGSYRSLETTANPQLSTLVALKTVLGFDLARIVPELFDARAE